MPGMFENNKEPIVARAEQMGWKYSKRQITESNIYDLMATLSEMRGHCRVSSKGIKDSHFNWIIAVIQTRNGWWPGDQ